MAMTYAAMKGIIYHRLYRLLLNGAHFYVQNHGYILYTTLIQYLNHWEHIQWNICYCQTQTM